MITAVCGSTATCAAFTPTTCSQDTIMTVRWLGWVVGGVVGVASGLAMQALLGGGGRGSTQAANTKMSPATRTGRTVPRARPVALSREEGRLYRLAEWYSLLALHATEARVADWAESREEALAEKLSTLSRKRGFDLSGVRCGSKTCTARARFKNYAAAVAGFQHLIEAQVGIGSSARTLLPEPDNPKLPYVASVLFEWQPEAERRAENLQPPVRPDDGDPRRERQVETDRLSAPRK